MPLRYRVVKDRAASNEGMDRDGIFQGVNTMNELITITELAALLKLSKRTVCNLMVDNTNPLPALRLGRSVRFRKSDVDAWLARLAESEAA